MPHIFNPFGAKVMDFQTSDLLKLYRYIAMEGDIHHSRIGPTFEIPDAVVTFSSYDVPYRPGMTRRLGMVEFLQVLSAYFDERLIARAAPGLLYPYSLTHAYGIKIAQQLERVVKQLSDNPETRRAVIYIGKPEDGAEGEKPCMQLYQFQIRFGTLSTTVYARSWDAYAGLPYDVITANGIAQAVANYLGVLPHRTTFHAASLHIYQRDYQRLPEKSASTKPPYNYFEVQEAFGKWEQWREWAIDQLNDYDNWQHGLPKGVFSGVR